MINLYLKCIHVANFHEIANNYEYLHRHEGIHNSENQKYNHDDDDISLATLVFLDVDDVDDDNHIGR